MYKFLFDYFTSSFSLFKDPINNYFAMAVVGIIAFLVAWNVVGKLYRSDIIEGRGIGSFLHWVIRFIVFIVIWFIFATVIRVINWIRHVPVYVWVTAVGAIVIIGIVVDIARFFILRKSIIK